MRCFDCQPRVGLAARTNGAAFLFSCVLLAALLTLGCEFAAAQTKPSQKFPPADKVVEKYLKATGGKKRLAAIRDTTSEWTVSLEGRPIGTARWQTKGTASTRSEMTFANGQLISATNSSSAWSQDVERKVRTMTGPEAAVAKLKGVLDATRLVNIKKANVLAHVVSIEHFGDQQAYVIEFSLRNGARLLYWFGAKDNLLLKIIDAARKTETFFEDYRNEQGLLEPHRMRVKLGSGELVLTMSRITYDTGIADAIFDAPRESEKLDVVSLLRAVSRNQDEVEKRVTEYAFVQKETEREINSKGEIKKETVKVYEVFPVAHHQPIQKLIEEDGKPLSPERAAKEEKRVQEELVKAEREGQRNEENERRRREERIKKGRNPDEEAELEISQFLRACEFVSPRHERFEGRDVVVFDFRPQVGFHPLTRGESLISKLVGAVWIDPIDKQVIRLEARLAEGFKMGGGLVFSLKPGAAFVMEQTRMAEGVWLPRLAQINYSVKVLLFGGGDMNQTIEWSNYRHFSGDVKEYTLDSPKPEKKPE